MQLAEKIKELKKGDQSIDEENILSGYTKIFSNLWKNVQDLS